ncbi:hypothetical protein [Kitasatospora purpeofusca]|uniref:Uncharacterized protein n=1 Tax=Kitasatospora purpeofusca TaxID=67352 RepID=A0ABZ1UB99_9ACTN|nr:hypothetical protein [Kitasatospora purpeofusca]
MLLPAGTGPSDRPWALPHRHFPGSRRTSYDLVHSRLIAVSATSNRDKGDKNPSLWRPPAAPYWSTCSRVQAGTKHVHGLSVTTAENAASNEMLDACA